MREKKASEVKIHHILLKSIYFSSFMFGVISCNNSGGQLIATPTGGDTGSGNISCPINYIPVPANQDVGTSSAFCVMKYEARNDGSNNPESRASGSPYTNVSITQAKSKCQALNASGKSNYDLISNAEWMTIARNVEAQQANFDGSGNLARGFSKHSWSNTAPASSSLDSCLYNDGANSCSNTGDTLFKRTLSLSNGEVIWDFSGNVYEWVDWSLSAQLTAGPTNCDNATTADFSDLTSNACYNNGLSENDLSPLTNNADNFLGFGTWTAFNGIGGYASRGGSYNNSDATGIFSLTLISSNSDTGPDVGFRCVYRP